MKRIARPLALILCLMLIASPIGSALSEAPIDVPMDVPVDIPIAAEESAPVPSAAEAQSAPEAPEADPAPGESAPTESSTPDEVPGEAVDSVEGEDGVSSDDVQQMPTEGSEGIGGNASQASGEGASEEAPQTPVIDYARSADASPDFHLGYAELIGDCLAYDGPGLDAGAVCLLHGGVVYVLERRVNGETDRLASALDVQGVRAAWIDAKDLRPLSPQEAQVFVERCSTREGVQFLPDHPEIPLDAPKFSLIEAKDEATVSPEAESAHGVVSADAESAHGVVSADAESAHGVVSADAESADGIVGTDVEGAHGIVSEDVESAGGIVSAEAESAHGIVSADVEGAHGIVSEDVEGADGIASAVNAESVDGIASVDADEGLAAEPVASTPAMVVPQREFTLGVGESCTADASFDDGQSHTINYSSTNAKIAKVSSAGKITGVKAGTTTIALSSEFGEEIELTVTVRSAPSKVSLRAPRTTLGVNEEIELTATLPSSASSALSFSSSAPAVATVDAEGQVNTLSPGTATITVKTFNSKKASVKLTVKPAPQAIALSEHELSIAVQDSAKLTAKLNAGSAGAYSFRVEPEGSDVLTVDEETGEITAQKLGNVIVIVETYNHVSDRCEVVVTPAPGRIELSPSEATLGVGETMPLPVVTLYDQEGNVCAGRYSFASEDKKYATVDAAKGTIKAVKKTDAVGIIVTAYNGVQAEFTLHVASAPTKVSLSGVRTTLGVGEKLALTAKLTPASATSKLSFSCSAPAKNTPAALEVDSDGNVTALNAGTATVTVKTFNSKKASVKLTVKPAPQAIELSEHELTIAAEDSAKLTAKLNAGSAGAYSFRVEPLDSDVLTVDEVTGEITALKPGNAAVVVETYNNLSDRCEVTVTPAPGRIELSMIEATLGVGETMPLPAVTLYDEEGNICAGRYSFASEDKKYATVDAAKGTIKAVKKTDAVGIIVTAYNGAKAEFTLHVASAPTKVSLSGVRTTLGVGEKLALTAKLTPASATSKLSFSCSAPAKNSPAALEVDSDGNVTAMNAGTATVTVKTFNSKKASVKLTVKPAPQAIELSEHELTIAAEDSAKLTAKLNAGSAGGYRFRVEPESSDVLTVDAATGEITALRPGNATVVVETYNQVNDRCEVVVTPAPGRIELSMSEATLGVGETMPLPAVTLYDQEDKVCAGRYSFASEDKKYATVDAAKGTIKAVKKTDAVGIIVTAYNGAKAEFTLHVASAPTKVSLSGVRTTLGVGEKLALTAKLTPASATSKLSFSCSAPAKNSPAALEVDSEGNVTALNAGTATVTVKTFNSKKASAKFTVKPAPQAITLSEHELSIAAQDSAKLTATLNTGSAGGYSFRVEPEGSDVLTVDAATGEITALKPGTATVVVETYNNVSDRCEVVVTPAPGRIELSMIEATLGVGETMPLPTVTLYDQEGNVCAGRYSFASEDKKYATVDAAKGTIKAVKKTDAVGIIVTAYNGAKAEFTLHVASAPTKVALSAHHTRLGVGEELDLMVKLTPAAASTKLTFSSNNEDVLTVDESGRVHAGTPGVATVTVQTFNKKKATLKLTVRPAPVGVSLPESISLGQGEAYTVDHELSPADSDGGIRFWVDDPSVASVDEISGKLTGLSHGDTTLHVELYNGAAAQCPLHVGSAPDGIAFRDENFTLGVGDMRQLQPLELLGEGAASAKSNYKSSNTYYVKVSATGLVTAVRAGTAKITASTFNKTSATITVTVKAAAKSIAFAEEQHLLFIGDEFAPEVTFANNIPGSYTLVSSNPLAAEIGPDGRSVRGVAAGTAQISATSYNGKVAPTPLTVTVPALPTRVWLEPGALLLGEGDGETLRACMDPGEGAKLEFWTDDGGVASLENIDNETVRVNAVASGATTLHLRTQNGLEAQARVEVRSAPTVLTLSPSVAQRCIEEGSLQLRVGYGGDAEGGSVRFESSNPAVATVDAGGLVRFLATGEARITARSYNGHTATCALTIGNRPTNMYFEQAEYRVALGDCVRIPASFASGCESYSLTAADQTIASTSSDEVRGLALGATTLRAVSRSGLEASCTLTVVEAPTSIELDAERIELTFGTKSTAQLHATALPSGAGSVTYTSSDPAVASVDSVTGEVTACANGDCTIHAVSFNGCRAECQVHVGALLEGVRIGIDPGHQGKANTSKESSSPNGGASKFKVSSGTAGKATHIKEHVTVLQVGFQLRDALTRLGAEVYMTRESADVDISNKQRAIMMNTAGADGKGVDLVLRLHCNSASSSSVQGVSVYIRQSCAYSNSVVDRAKLMDAESRAASAVYNRFIEATGCAKFGIRRSNEYTMNNWSTVPCLLVELGFMSNPDEDRKLNDPGYQAQMVRGMVNGICEYMGRELPSEE